MRRLMNKKAMILITAALLMILSLSTVVFADSESKSFTYNYPVDGVTFRLYEVGEVVDNELILTGKYADYNVDPKETTAAETLAAYVERDKLEPNQTAVSAKGTLTFDNLEMKIYLMTGDTAIVNREKWIPSAVLFSVPQMDEESGELIWNITAEGKYTKEELPEVTEVTVEKIWNDKGYEKKRPVSIKAELLKDGEVYDTVELNKTNNWKHTWTNLDPESTWKVVEQEVPGNYTLNIEMEEGITILKNTYKKTNTPPPTTPNSEIPYTGQLWWPVGILVIAGFCLILMGLIFRKKSEY